MTIHRSFHLAHVATGIALLAAISATACAVEDEALELETDSASVIGGTIERDYQFPWSVEIRSPLKCGAVMLDRYWVLTAAHCITDNTPAVWVKRTDPYTGVEYSSGPHYARTVPSRLVFKHPDYDSSSFAHDIALFKLEQPLDLDDSLQPVKLPRSAPTVGQIGAVPNKPHGGIPAPAGYVAVMRAPITQTNCGGLPSAFCIQSPTAALCDGDSGTGFVSTVNERATVVGLASFVTVPSDCATPGIAAGIADVFAHRDWILATMGTTIERLDGNARLRRTGRAANGFLRLDCERWFGGTATEGPAYVPGLEVGIQCPIGSYVRATCDIGGSFGVKLTGFQLRTTDTRTGAVAVSNLPYGSNYATYRSGYNATLTKLHEFTCSVGTSLKTRL